MKILLYELWVFFHCEALNITFWNMFIGWGSLGLCLPDPSTAFWCHCTVLFITQSTAIMWILFVFHVFLSFHVFKNHSLFLKKKKSNFPFMKQYKINEMYFQNRSPRQYFRSFLKWPSHFNMSTRIKDIIPCIFPVVPLVE